MGCQRRKSTRILEQAEVRAAGLAAINSAIDFGDDRSLQNLNQQTNELQERINDYNTALTTVDNIRNDIKAREKALSELSEKMLIGVAFQYGKDSAEYEMAGGVRKSDRVRRSSYSRMKAEEESVNAS